MKKNLLNFLIIVGLFMLIPLSAIAVVAGAVFTMGYGNPFMLGVGLLVSAALFIAYDLTRPNG